MGTARGPGPRPAALVEQLLNHRHFQAHGTGRPDLRFHDLRHTGQTLAAAAGANLRELMARAGQSSPGAALRYLHEVDGRQREIAERLAVLATAGNVTPIKAAAPRRPRKRKEGTA